MPRCQLRLQVPFHRVREERLVVKWHCRSLSHPSLKMARALPAIWGQSGALLFESKRAAERLLFPISLGLSGQRQPMQAVT